MAHRRDGWHFRRKQGSRNNLFVERPEILKRATTATHDQHVERHDAGFFQLVSLSNGRRDLLCCTFTLHGDREDVGFCMRASSLEHSQNILQCGTGCRSHHPDMGGIVGHSLLAVCLEESFL